ncbi:sister chromatid cohesion protein-like protein Dcc1 [Pseudovirgaria hyperparasitica]|uniref:Sister chromatid cohesion protein-like protein Dcc1 n=1 Tax=Pseudovirgaria hyperparasitica TaxID=470096 RepID=A0A6A6VWX7_9PEZI|nr:sister chromatid cohesion protein-like protein Dcc1 [Pseudovirgaria hyperparasitica]KAF2754359.1 sister chromatid cohesion protein-like protein Dcc1 [Pseudovirgaria hyperparasitica]
MQQMSTQDHARTALTITAEQEAFKLLELPQGILDLISSPEPPILHIKSLDALSSSSKPAYVALCTKDQTYQLRQVQTSNSVYVTRAAPFRSPGSILPQSSVSAIASCSHTLELHPSKDSPLVVLRQLLPEYREADDVVLLNNSARSKVEIFANIPSSDGECERAWGELCAFEVEGRSWCPSPAAIHEAWRVLLTAAIAESIPLISSFSLAKLHDTLMDEKMPIEFFESLILRISTAGHSTEELTLDKPLTIEWLGKVTLQVLTETNSEIPLSQFMAAWREALPDEWEQDVKIDAIKGFYTQPNPRLIAVKSHIADRTVNSKSGKWHEKFKARR